MHTSDLFKDTEKYLADSNKKFLAGDQIKIEKWIHENYTKLDRSNMNRIVYEHIKRKRKEDPNFYIIDLSVNRTYTRYEVVLEYIENDNRGNDVKDVISLEKIVEEMKESDCLLV